MGAWKRLRNEIATHIIAHAYDENWQATVQSCGEHDAPAIGVVEKPPAPKPGKAAVSAALAAWTGAVLVRPEVLDAVRLVVGLTEHEKHVAERLVRNMGHLEKDAILKWKEEEQPDKGALL